jgi:hypothetical protein
MAQKSRSWARLGGLADLRKKERRDFEDPSKSSSVNEEKPRFEAGLRRLVSNGGYLRQAGTGLCAFASHHGT